MKITAHKSIPVSTDAANRHAVKPSRTALLFFVERLRLLGVEFLGIGSARAGHAEEQLAPVGKRHVARVRALLVMVARLITIDDDFGAFRKRVLIGAAAEQRVGAPPSTIHISLAPSSFLISM